MRTADTFSIWLSSLLNKHPQRTFRIPNARSTLTCPLKSFLLNFRCGTLNQTGKLLTTREAIDKLRPRLQVLWFVTVLQNLLVLSKCCCFERLLSLSISTSNQIFGRSIWDKLPKCIFGNFEIALVKQWAISQFLKITRVIYLKNRPN